jgi:adenylate cyclase class 2
LTYKGPVQPIAGAQASHSRSALTGKRYKQREELELTVRNPGMLNKILSSLGYGPGFRYEKYRTTYRLRALPHLAVDLDETPVGVFLELEGPRPAIDKAAKLLGYSPQDYSDQTYWDVYRDYCGRHGIPVRNMVFSD